MPETEMEKWVRETNEAPKFFLQGKEVFQRGGASMGEDDKASFSLNFPVLTIHDIVTEPEAVVAILNKGWDCKCDEDNP